MLQIREMFLSNVFKSIVPLPPPLALLNISVMEPKIYNHMTRILQFKEVKTLHVYPDV